MPGSGRDQSDQAQLAAAIQEVSEKLQVLVREEIELAKAEVEVKAKKLIRGVVAGVAAGIFAGTALLYLLHGFSWLAWWALPVGDTQYFWGFFVVAAVLLLIGAIAGFLAYKGVQAGAPPTPNMAIDEAKLIRETIETEFEKKGTTT